MKIKNTLKQLVEQVTSLSNKKRVSIKYKIFIGAVLFIILNIIINLLIVKVSINDIYLALEKKELKSVYSNILKTNDSNNITDIEDIKKFADLSFKYSAEHSTDKEFVFIKQ